MSAAVSLSGVLAFAAVAAGPVQDGHAGHDPHAAHRPPATTAQAAPRTPIPVLTDADRAAAVRPAGGHAAHDDGPHRFVLFDRLEAGRDGGHSATAWELEAWHGTDVQRLWLRSEGERAGGRTHHADVELLYGRSVSPWWDVVGGVRHDFGEAPSATWAAFGVQGMTPYKIELAATAYVGGGGNTGLRVEAEYDTLLTNRLILQWVAEADAYGERDAARRIGRGLNAVEAGVRLRYEIRREFAPYAGIAWERAYGDVADWRRADGEDVDDVRFVAGVRFWF